MFPLESESLVVKLGGVGMNVRIVVSGGCFSQRSNRLRAIELKPPDRSRRTRRGVLPPFAAKPSSVPPAEAASAGTTTRLAMRLRVIELCHGPLAAAGGAYTGVLG